MRNLILTLFSLYFILLPNTVSSQSTQLNPKLCGALGRIAGFAAFSRFKEMPRPQVTRIMGATFPKDDFPDEQKLFELVISIIYSAPADAFRGFTATKIEIIEIEQTWRKRCLQGLFDDYLLN